MMLLPGDLITFSHPSRAEYSVCMRNAPQFAKSSDHYHSLVITHVTSRTVGMYIATTYSMSDKHKFTLVLVKGRLAWIAAADAIVIRA